MAKIRNTLAPLVVAVHRLETIPDLPAAERAEVHQTLDWLKYATQTADTAFTQPPYRLEPQELDRLVAELDKVVAETCKQVDVLVASLPPPDAPRAPGGASAIDSAIFLRIMQGIDQAQGMTRIHAGALPGNPVSLPDDD